MKKRFNLSIWDINLIELADILIAFWIVGLLLGIFSKAGNFFVDFTWFFFALGIILGIRPLYKLLYGEKDKKMKITKKVRKRR